MFIIVFTIATIKGFAVFWTVWKLGDILSTIHKCEFAYIDLLLYLGVNLHIFTIFEWRCAPTCRLKSLHPLLCGHGVLQLHFQLQSYY